MQQIGAPTGACGGKIGGFVPSVKAETPREKGMGTQEEGDGEAGAGSYAIETPGGLGGVTVIWYPQKFSTRV